MLKTFDFDGNGLLDSDEIMSAFSVAFSGSKSDKIKALFYFYDKDDSATLEF